MAKYNPEYHREYYLKNREKKKAASKAWKKANPKKARSYRKNETDLRLKRKFGISLDDYNLMFEKQQGLCAICNRPEKNKKLAVDHCHATGRVRGLLCSKCNQALGMLDDNIEFMRKAINYLQHEICNSNSNKKDSSIKE